MLTKIPMSMLTGSNVDVAFVTQPADLSKTVWVFSLSPSCFFLNHNF